MWLLTGVLTQTEKEKLMTLERIGNFNSKSVFDDIKGFLLLRAVIVV